MLNFDKVIDKTKPLFIAAGNLKWYSHFEKLKFLKKKNVSCLYELATLMFSNHPREMKMGPYSDLYINAYKSGL